MYILYANIQNTFIEERSKIMAKQLIIHADDYGLTRSVSQGIIRAHRNGVVTSASVMINLAQRADIIELLENPSLDIGVHLNLTVGKSVLPKEKIPHLVDKNGYFHKRKTEKRPVNDDGVVIFDDVPVEEIILEMETQIRHFMGFDLEPTHLDSHHHIHTDPKVLEAVIFSALNYNLPLRTINPEMREKVRSRGVRTNDYFEGRFFGIDSINFQNMANILADISDGVTELMCHPGEVSDELGKISGYADERLTEFNVLINPELRALIKKEGIELISWRDLE